MGPGSFEGSPDDCSPWAFVPREQYEPRACDVRIRLHFHLVRFGAELPLALIAAQVDVLNRDFSANLTGIGFEFDPASDVTRLRRSVSGGISLWKPRRA